MRVRAIRSSFLDKRVRFSGGAAAIQCGMLFQPKMPITLLRRKKPSVQALF